jgi:hypothetical protein
MELNWLQEEMTINCSYGTRGIMSHWLDSLSIRQLLKRLDGILIKEESLPQEEEQLTDVFDFGILKHFSQLTTSIRDHKYVTSCSLKTPMSLYQLMVTL